MILITSCAARTAAIFGQTLVHRFFSAFLHCSPFLGLFFGYPRHFLQRNFTTYTNEREDSDYQILRRFQTEITRFVW